MKLIGYLFALMGLFGLYENQLILGGIIFVLGGFIARKVSPSIRSSGLLLMLLSIAYGYHNSFTVLVIFLIFVGFVMACFNSRRTSSHSDNGGYSSDYSGDWGFDIHFSASNSGCGGDSGGDSGGGDGGGD